MADWRFSIGNLVSRAARAPVAVAPAAADTLLPLANLGSGYPDQQGGFAWRSDGTYAGDFDLNLLAETSTAADAPTGWRDLINVLSGTPGLPANPPDWGSYGAPARNPSLRIFRPALQRIDVMPGETVALRYGLHRPTGGGATATAARVRVVDSWSGLGWNGAAWADGGILDSQAAADTWKDATATITPDPNRSERSTYLVVFEPVAAAYDATSYVYISDNGAAGSPALYAEVDVVALVGHNLPATAVVSLAQQPSGAAFAILPAQPSCYTIAGLPVLARTWRLSIQMPAGVQPRPELGEVWIGKARTLIGHAPTLPIGITEGSPGQARAEGGSGRLAVVGTGTPTRSSLVLQFVFDDAAYRQGRDAVARLTRFGEEPMLLLPIGSFERISRLYHGRLGAEVGYSLISPGEADALHVFSWDFEESPLAAR